MISQAQMSGKRVSTRPPGIRFALYLTGLLWIFAIILAGCDGGGGDGSSAVKSENDAFHVARTIRYSATDVAPGDEETYVDERIDGFEGGYAIVSGYYEKNSTFGFNEKHIRTYDNVQIAFFDYVNDSSTDPALTGNAVLNGSYTTYASSGGNTYSGKWTLSGSVSLSGRYSGTVTYYIEIYGNGWAGVVNADGVDWTVSSIF